MLLRADIVMGVNNNKVVSKSTTTRWAIFLLGLVAFLLLFVGLGNRWLWGSEGRWAEIPREMFLTGDFFHPRIGGEPYFDKPLLTYWFIIAITAVTGILNEWVVRLPSAFFGLVSIFATVLLGRRLWSARVGLLAGWFLLTSYGFIFWSRTADADTENLAAITLCVLWYWTSRDKPNFMTFLIFYLIAFIGALTKGLTAVFVPIAAILPDLVTEKRWKILFRPSHILAFGISLAVYLSPFIYAAKTCPADYHSSGLALVFQENFLRYFHATDHKGPFYLYLYAAPLLVLPWAPLLAASLVGLLFAWKNIDSKTRWLMMAMAAIFIFFTLSGSRRDYYILPITPLCALLMAVFLFHIVDVKTNDARSWGIKVQKYFCMGMVLLEIMLPFVLLVLKTRDSFSFFVKLSVSGIILGAAALVVWLIIQKYGSVGKLLILEMRPLAGLIAVTVIVFGGFFCWQQNIVDNFRTERPFIDEVKTQVDGWPAGSIGFFPKNDAKLLFYLNKKEPIPILKTASDWDSFLSGQTPKLVIMQSRDEEKIPAGYGCFLQKQPDIMEKVQPWDSASSRREKWRAWVIEAKGNSALIQSVSRNEKNKNYAN
jgi:hypothetical protein